MYQNFLSIRDLADLAAFKHFRNKLNSELRKARKEYYTNIFEKDGRCDAKLVWKTINAVINTPKPSNSIGSLTINGVTLMGTELADSFNKHFIGLPKTDYNKDATCLISVKTPDSFFLPPTHPFEVFATLMALKNSSSLDAEGLSVKPIKFVADLLAPHLSYIFNLSISCSAFPDRLKLAKVIVIHKSGATQDMGNYRPLSILPLFSKPLEKILLKRLENYFNDNRLFTDSQFGFRQGLSTESALLKQKELILQNIENKLLTLGIFVDFSKAFDCINHDILLDKLYAYGIRGNPLKLIRSYLEERQQSVWVDGCSSSFEHIRCGVPQGSILGPFLFNVFINDLVHISKKAKFIIYADDTSLFLSGNSSNELLLEANVILESLHNWSHVNSLMINHNKTKAVIFRSINRNVTVSIPLLIGDYVIEIVNKYKSLGVIFDEHLKWADHFRYLSSNLSKSVGALSRGRDLFPVKVKKLIYHSLFHSQISYCHLVWGTAARMHLTQLLLLQKKAIRIVSGSDYLTHTRPLFIKHRIPPIHHLVSFTILRALNNLILPRAKFIIQLSSVTQSHTHTSTRRKEKWHLPRLRTTYGSQMLHFVVPNTLNTNKWYIENMNLSKKTFVQQFFEHVVGSNPN